MVKTNFTKVEEALNEGLGKIQKQKLLEEADKAQGKEAQTEESKKKDLITKLQDEVKKLHKKHKDSYEKLNIPKKLLKLLIKEPDKLLTEEWDSLQKIKQAVDIYKKSLKPPRVEQSDDDIIQSEQHKHITKRFNVNDKWLPLQ